MKLTNCIVGSFAGLEKIKTLNSLDLSGMSLYLDTSALQQCDSLASVAIDRRESPENIAALITSLPAKCHIDFTGED